MHKLAWAGLALAIGTATPALADVFDGTWKVDLGATSLPKKPDVYLLKDGMMRCSSCTPAYTVKADGRPHAVAGHDYFDSVTVQVVDPKTVDMAFGKAGKTVSKTHYAVSPDGKMLGFTFTDMTGPKPVTGAGTEERIAATPAGAHSMSGSWRMAKLSQLSDTGSTISFKVNGDTLVMSQPSGQGYTAKFGGPPVPVKGDPAMTMAAVKRIGPNRIEETDMRKGKPVSRITMAVSPDGKTMTATIADLIAGTTTTYKATKQ